MSSKPVVLQGAKILPLFDPDLPKFQAEGGKNKTT